MHMQGNLFASEFIFIVNRICLYLIWFELLSICPVLWEKFVAETSFFRIGSQWSCACFGRTKGQVSWIYLIPVLQYHKVDHCFQIYLKYRKV